jgi:DEAD/DEAH box helicase domain-containing protein
VSLRSVTSDNFVIVDQTNGERVIGETDFTSGPSVLHEKAIYILEGQLYQVEKLDFDNRKAFVRAVDCDYYTDAIDYTQVTILEVFAGDAMPQEPVESPARAALAAAGLEESDKTDTRKEALILPPALAPIHVGETSAAALRSHGEVHVVSRVVGFKKIKFYTNENIGAGELDLPEQNMHTTSYWLRIPEHVMTALPFSTDDKRDGISGIAFAMHNIAPLLLMSDQGDIGVSVDRETIYLYDNYPGGIGFSEPLFSMHDLLLQRTRELIDECPCESGCPSCVGPIGSTGPHTKKVAQDMLRRMGAEGSTAVPAEAEESPF